MLKTLLLSASYEVISFVNERKAFKLLIKDKVEVVDAWDDIINWGGSKIKHPAILRLKKPFKRNFFNFNFSRKALVKRDRSTCLYCGQKLTASQITVDHVLPRAQGGITSFTNCVVACQDCNNRKADRTPEQAGMKLMRKPTHPSFFAHAYASTDPQEHWFLGWDDYLCH